MTLFRLVAGMGLLGAGVLVGRHLAHMDSATPETPAPMRKVRDAGPEAMDHPPRRWSLEDQQADESFPASDPPGNY